MSTETFDSSSQNHQETWEALRRELEDIGISPALITEKRQFIIAWFQEAVAAGRLEEDPPSDDDDEDDDDDNNNNNDNAGLSSISSNTTLLSDIKHHHHDNVLSPISASAHPASTAGVRYGNRNEELPVGGIHQDRHVAMLPVPPYPHGTFHADSSGSEIHIGDDGRASWRRHAGRDVVFPSAYSPIGISDDDSVIDRGMSTMALERRESEESTVERPVTENQRSSEQPGRANYSSRGPPSSPPLPEKKKKSRLRVSYLLNKLGRKNKQFLEAAMVGDVATIKELLEQGVDIKSRDKNGLTALTYARRNGHAAAVLLLLNNGADLKYMDRFGDTLRWASERGHVAVVSLLLDKGANIDLKNERNETALVCASEKGHAAVVRLLLDKGADIESKNNVGTALVVASIWGQVAVVQLLLNKGAYIESKTIQGKTALECASGSGYVEVVQLLLDKGADIESKNKDGDTALAWASMKGSVAVVQLLLDKGAIVDSANFYGKTALHYAELHKNRAVEQLLRSAGAR